VSLSQPSLAALLECLPDAAVVVDTDGRVIDANTAFQEAVDRPVAEIDGVPLARFLRAPGRGNRSALVASHFASSTGRAPLMSRGVLVARDGLRARCDLRVCRVEAEGHGLYLVILRSGGLERQRQLRLARAARIDALTGLVNRTVFTAEMEHAVHQAQRHGRRLALLFVDLDRFKEVNDGYGHERGDAVLRAVATRFARAVRIGDLLGRWGGDEFACLLPIDGDDRAPIDVADRLLAAVGLPIDLEEGALAVGASIGIAQLPGDASSASDLLAAADQALYEAKAKGGMQWQSFAPAMADRSRSRSQLRDDLGRAIHSAEMQLHYQPIVDAQTLEPVGTEALIRWQHPTRGLMGPSSFLTLLTSSPERALQLLQIQVDRALADLDHVVEVAPCLAINFDARLVGRPEAQLILTPLRERTWARGMVLMIELTEAAFNEQPERLQRFVRDVRGQGIRLAIDDFGGGEASLLRLREITFDVLKVDRAFIRDIADSPRDRTISGLAAKVAGELSSTSVAEGVETAAQLAWARRLGYRALQGFGIARPMPADDLVSWTREWRRAGRAALLADIARLQLD
jgi:diguanylate cyclase (GGDEF)-like protein